MRRFLRLIVCSSVFCLPFIGSASPGDTLKHKTNVYLGLNYGISFYNNLKLKDISGNGEEYAINSKPKSYYEVNFSLSRKRNNFSVGISLIQSSFSGKSASYGAGRYNGLRYQYYYNISQKINYSVYYIFVGYSRDFHISKKHMICPSINLFAPLKYQFRIDNNYDKDQTYDTTLVSLTKNATNDDTNFGHFPRLNLGLSYKYNPIEKIGIIMGVSCLYGLSYASKIPGPVKYGSVYSNGNNYSFVAYDIRKQFVLIATLGINFKLK